MTINDLVRETKNRLPGLIVPEDSMSDEAYLAAIVLKVKPGLKEVDDKTIRQKASVCKGINSFIALF